MTWFSLLCFTVILIVAFVNFHHCCGAWVIFTQTRIVRCTFRQQSCYRFKAMLKRQNCCFEFSGGRALRAYLLDAQKMYLI